MSHERPRLFVRLAQALLVALAAAGGLAAIGWASGRIALVERARPGTSEPAHVAAEPKSPERADAKATPHADPSTAARAKVEVEVARYTVCGREEAPARLYELDARASGSALWAVSCGATAHILAIEAEQGIVLARRVAQFSLPSPAPDRAPRPAPIAWLPDGPAWLVTTLRIDRNGSPAGGAIFRVSLERSDLADAPVRLHDAAPFALATASFDRAEGRDFALLQLGDPRIAQAGELWLFSGGASPTRIARKPVQPDAIAIAPLDLDGDGIDEVAVLARAGGGLVTVHAAGDATPLGAATPGADGIHALDQDGDGRRELIASGARAFAVARDPSASEPMLSAVPAPALDGLRDLMELDVDADGRSEITGYAHPNVVAVFPAREDATRERRMLFELTGEGFAVLQARPAHLDGDGRIDLIALVAGEDGDLQVELVLARSIGKGPLGSKIVPVPSEARALRNAPLLRRIELR